MDGETFFAGCKGGKARRKPDPAAELSCFVHELSSPAAELSKFLDVPDAPIITASGFDDPIFRICAVTDVSVRLKR